MSMVEPSLPAGYPALLEQIKQHVRSAQLQAARAVNAQLVVLYWRIGRLIVDRQAEEGWGARVIDRLASDLRTEFPGVRGFSPRNLQYMRAFAAAFPDAAIAQQPVAQLPWGHAAFTSSDVSHPQYVGAVALECPQQ